MMSIERVIVYLLGSALAFNVLIPGGIIACAIIQFLSEIGVI